MRRSSTLWPLLALCGCGVMQSSSKFRLESEVPSDEVGLSNALYQATGRELVEGNQVDLVNNGHVFDVLADDIAHAKHSINIVLFIWRPGEPSDRLLPIVAERARAGVQCRVIADAMASIDFAKKIQPVLEEAGCEVRRARRAFTIDRNHRKIVVIDGEIGITGGLGVYKSWLGDGRHTDQWRETNVRVRGPVVAQMQQAFAENWMEESSRLLPMTHFPHLEHQGAMTAAFVSSAQSDHITAAERLTHLTMAAAKKRLWIGNAYFLPTPGMVELLLEKRRQGVDVRVIAASEQIDHREILELQRLHYKKLLAAGVRIFEYQPAMFHPKTMLVDDAISVVGSINLDKLSQAWLDEGSLLVVDEGFAKQMERDWNIDQESCREIQP